VEPGVAQQPSPVLLGLVGVADQVQLQPFGDGGVDELAEGEALLLCRIVTAMILAGRPPARWVWPPRWVFLSAGLVRRGLGRQRHLRPLGSGGMGFRVSSTEFCCWSLAAAMNGQIASKATWKSPSQFVTALDALDEVQNQGAACESVATRDRDRI